MRRLYYCLFFILCTSAGLSQNFTYSDQEIKNSYEPFLIAIPPNVHLWQWGNTGVSLNSFNGSLKQMYTGKLSSVYRKVSFVHFKEFYYAVLSAPHTTEVYRISKDGTYKKTAASLNRQLRLKDLFSYNFYQGTNFIFLVQQKLFYEDQKTQVHLIALDSSFSYLNEMVFDIKFIDYRPQNITLTPVGNSMLLINQTLVENNAVLNLTKINIVQKTYYSKLIHTEGIRFVSHKVIVDNDEVILQSEAGEENKVKFVKEAFSYYFRLDTNLKILDHFYANSVVDHYPIDSNYLYRPVLKAVLPDGQLFSVHYGRHKTQETRSNAEIFRFMWMDKHFKLLRVLFQPTTDKKYFPVIFMPSNGKINIYYEEVINKKVTIISGYQLDHEKTDHRPLQLIPGYSYHPTKAVLTSASSFIMPYSYKSKIGLVKVWTDKQ